MKRLLFSFFIAVISAISATAQIQVTKFLGIPIDGPKKEMINKLEAKGFEYDANQDFLTGEFNGYDVRLYVVTHNNKVCRIMVSDQILLGESAIKNRYNTLIGQFSRNKRYVKTYPEGDPYIGDDVDISYEKSVNNKRFDAVFLQKIDLNENVIWQIKQMTIELLSKKFSQEQLENPTAEITKAIEDVSKELVKYLSTMMPVWFYISDYNGEYYITMFYDNAYNQAQGEDL